MHAGHEDGLCGAGGPANPGFTVSPLIELDQMSSVVPGGVLNAGDGERRQPKPWASRAAALQVGGRPVVFIYHADLSASAAWAQVRQDLVEPQSVHRRRHHEPGGWLRGPLLLQPERRLRQRLARRLGCLARDDSSLRPGCRPFGWTTTALGGARSPGEDDSLLGRPPANTIVIPRLNGTRYTATWQAAWDSEPEWALVSTWNEWYEATNISPGVQTGTRR